MKWPMVKLGDVVDFIGGSQPPKSTFKYAPEDGYTRLLQIRDYRTDSYPTYIPTDSTKKFCTKKDVMIGRYGPPVFQILRGLKGAYNVALMKAIPCEKIDRNYLYYFLKQDKLFHLIDGLSQRTAGQSGIDMDALKAYPMLLPPLEEQKRIAAILDKADAIRRKRQQAIQLADEFLRSVFLDMFGDPVTNPKGLPQVKLTELSDVISGYAFKSSEYIEDGEDSVRLCRGANTLTGYFDWKDTAYWNKEKLAGIQNYKIKAGDVILAMDRPWISSGLKVCVFPENVRDTYLVQRVARIRPKNPKYTDFLYASILSKAFEKHCCPTETTVPHISPVELKNFNVLVPDEKLVDKYHDAVVKVRKSKLAMQKLAVEASNASNSLSQKAFACEL